MKNTTLYVRHNARTLLALALLAGLLVAFLMIHPRGVSPTVLTAWSNQGVALALVAIGQTIVVLTSGIDISIGAIMALSNCVASELVQGDPIQVALGVAAVLLVGTACGTVNGLIIVYARIQPIVATLATGTIYTGIALLVRPTPGGEVSAGLSDTMTGTLGDLIPTSLIALAVVVTLVWEPLRRSLTGRTLFALGSAEQAAYMSGLSIDKAKVVAYAVAGLFAAMAGLFLGFQTASGDASVGLPYTLNSVAAVVLGGTVLSGGVASVVGTIAGAFMLRTIGSLMFFTGVPPLAQPLFEGLVLICAVALGSVRLLRIRNRLEIFK